jgi:hypothetical protein
MSEIHLLDERRAEYHAVDAPEFTVDEIVRRGRIRRRRRGAARGAAAVAAVAVVGTAVLGPSSGVFRQASPEKVSPAATTSRPVAAAVGCLTPALKRDDLARCEDKIYEWAQLTDWPMSLNFRNPPSEKHRKARDTMPEGTFGMMLARSRPGEPDLAMVFEELKISMGRGALAGFPSGGESITLADGSTAIVTTVPATGDNGAPGGVLSYVVALPPIDGVRAPLVVSLRTYTADGYAGRTPALSNGSDADARSLVEALIAS